MAEWGKKSRGFLTFVKEKGRVWLLLGGALLGVVLLLLGSFGGESETTAEPDSISAREEELVLYEARMEKELELLVESVAGVGDAEILLSFESGYTVRYTKDNTGGAATIGTGSHEQALFSTVVPPVVSGVGVVCRGGNSPAVQKTLTDLLSTALGIPSNRVYITGK